MKPLLPSLREKKRYMAINVTISKPVQPSETYEAIRSSFRTLMGSLAAAKANIKLISEKSKPQRIIIRLHRNYVDAARAAICLIQTIGSEPALLSTTRVSGSLATAEES